jgi:predicted transcriptional regulator
LTFEIEQKFKQEILYSIEKAQKTLQLDHFCFLCNLQLKSMQTLKKHLKSESYLLVKKKEKKEKKEKLVVFFLILS